MNSPINSVDLNIRVNVVDNETLNAVVLNTHTYGSPHTWLAFASPLAPPRELLNYDPM